MTEIVVGLDDSPSAAAALRWAAEQSRVTGLPLRALCAWQRTAHDLADRVERTSRRPPARTRGRGRPAG